MTDAIKKLAPHEQKLVEALKDCLDYGPTRIVPIIATTLAENDVRVVMAAVGEGLSEQRFPQVEVTVDTEDVTETTATQILYRMLEKLGVPAPMIPTIASLAGTSLAKLMGGRNRAKCSGGTCPSGRG